MRKFQDLNIWLRSQHLTLNIYKITSLYPSNEIFVLVSQMRRSAVSIPSNIAEGCGKNSDAEMKRYLSIAAGSCSELQYQIILSKDLNYISENTFKELDDEVTTIRKMIFSFIEKLSHH